jgi:uncharacterized protein (TIGR03435 family)
MQELDDMTLLREYAERDSESAFSTLVTRHVNLVFSTARRNVGNAAAAEDVSQAVFIILAKKAPGLARRTGLSGWLHQTTRLTAANYLRTEIRRAKREQEAYMQSLVNEPESRAWIQIAPLLDAALGELSESDRAALVMRFFENKSAREMALALRIDQSAAQKRVTRAVERLRIFFAGRGVVLPATVIAGAISTNSVQAAPMVLAKSITAVAVTKGATASSSILTLIKTTLKIMAWTKMKTAIFVGVGILLAAGTTTVTVKKIEAHRSEESWRFPDINTPQLAKVAPQVNILPTKFPDSKNNLTATPDYLKWVGINERVADFIFAAYSWPPGRIIFETTLPQGGYDFISTLPNGSEQGLQNELKKKFGLVGRREIRDMDVLLLKVRNPNAPGLGHPRPDGGNGRWGHGYYNCQDAPISNPDSYFDSIISRMEDYFGMPVIDQTGLTQHFSIDLKWNELGEQDPKHNALKQALLDQLGLELVPSRAPVEMLVVKKSK